MDAAAVASLSTVRHMGVVIDFCARPHIGVNNLDSKDDADWFFEWNLPEHTRVGDIGVLFAGGRRRCYLGLEKVTSRWKKHRGGPLDGEWYVNAVPTVMFRVPVPAAAVEDALGIPAPTDAARLDDSDGAALVALLKRYQRATDGEVEALEGIMTETRRKSRSRSPKLRAEKLRLARGRCEGCGTNFGRYRGLDARRVLTVHHRDQISAFDEPRTVRLEDLAVVCANCHMLIHADPQRALPVEELAARLATTRRR